MTLAELRARITAQPFRPYALTWGNAYFVVDRPEAVACDERGERLIVHLSPGVQISTTMATVTIEDVRPQGATKKDASHKAKASRQDGPPATACTCTA